MPRNLLKALQVDRIKPSDKVRMYPDGDGLYLRVKPSGLKDWVFVFRYDGKQRRMGLGKYPDVPLSGDENDGGARGRADRARQQLADGQDPITRRQTEHRVAREARLDSEFPKTVKALFEKWEENELVNIRADAGASVRRAFEKDVFPEIGDLPIGETRRRHIMAIRDRMMKRNVGRMTNVVLSELKQMWGYAIIREWVEIDPTARIERRQFGGDDNEDDRVLSGPEIKALFKKLPESGLKEITQLAIWIQLSTLCRMGEMIKSRWCNVNFEKRVWFLPKHIRKGSRRHPARDHAIHLSGFAVRKLERLKELTGNTPWLFPDRATVAACADVEEIGDLTFEGNHIDDKTFAKQITDRQGLRKLAGRAKCNDSLVLEGGKWRPHDLRRTGATMMVAIGISEATADKCLSHSDPKKVRRTYNRHHYEPEMMKAWMELGQYLETLVSSDDIFSATQSMVAQQGLLLSIE